MQDWLEERDVIFYDNTLEEIINNRTKLLHKADAFIRTMAILDNDMEKFLEVESLSDRLEAALSENRRLQRLFSASANGDIKPVDSSENKRSASATINIVGALCDLYWKMKHPDNPKINQAEIISALESYKDYDGLSERNLKDKLSKGIKAVRFE